MNIKQLSVSSVLNKRASAVVNNLYAETLRVDPIARQAAQAQGMVSDSAPGFYEVMRNAYMPVTPSLGALLFLLVRATRAKSIIEYGMSFGISTIFLAAALRENGGGKILTTEIETQKAERAYQNLVDAGLDDLVEIRVGDAMHTLAHDVPESVGFLLLDGAKADYLKILKALEPRLLSGALISADNSDMTSAYSFLEYVRDPGNGYTTSALFTEALDNYHGHLIAMKNG